MCPQRFTSAPSLPCLDSAQHCWIQGFSFLCFSLLIMPFLLLQHSIFEGPAQIPLSPRGFLSFFWALKECEFFSSQSPLSETSRWVCFAGHLSLMVVTAFLSLLCGLHRAMGKHLS